MFRTAYFSPADQTEPRWANGPFLTYDPAAAQAFDWLRRNLHDDDDRPRVGWRVEITRVDNHGRPREWSCEQSDGDLSGRLIIEDITFDAALAMVKQEQPRPTLPPDAYDALRSAVTQLGQQPGQPLADVLAKYDRGHEPDVHRFTIGQDETGRPTTNVERAGGENNG